ncbi:Sapep family Mn(2+)-dependent dipeptidase [Fimbriimonas ginsengisoli]|uniref:Acetylornithine deacetylase/Succinyl-diaminopimelate desuccinylase-related deacylase n=1 Tax=Fimbriimonas ginsengisoli Gsoil 348 TaxID=661478 RepID=A0A068NYD6_FIMGI|nr:Sapep family Mn(2+)-dependent dipeptidase [Fimbriimonas ginsengisoli]AIE86879.1 Acetylornithine deacetylase/Succinyl-diaminopimelate desuccinylase-related deacylase [Fimbriimonas ginsengisoli Gsoil 348]
MSDPIVAKIQDWLRAHEQELLDDTREMLQIPSLESEPLPNAPYGAENRRALDLALSLAKKYGFKTTDLEGHIGYGEFGQGDKLIVSLGHLDVVPVGPGWKHAPFGAEIDGGYIYGRGTTDDKGPTMASFYAMRAIKECVPEIGARMRQVFGCNEESGFGCVARYVQTEEPPTYGVAPDSGWPLYHAEKGIANLEISVPLNKGGEMELLEIEGGQRPNIVIDSCSGKVRVAAGALAHVDGKLADAWDRNVTFAWEGDVLGIFAIGKAAHGSTPFEGDSAAIRLLRFLKEISPLSSEPFFHEMFELTHIGGAGLGIAGSDEPSKDLTSNLGIVNTADGNVELLFNIRYPVTWSGEKLQSLCNAQLATLKSGFELKVTRDSPPLYFPLDHPLVKTIVEVYEEETGEHKAPGTMGGGTYARAIPNTVSIGTCWEGDGNAHETDERLKIENLFRASRIYAHILYRMSQMP